RRAQSRCHGRGGLDCGHGTGSGRRRWQNRRRRRAGGDRPPQETVAHGTRAERVPEGPTGVLRVQPSAKARPAEALTSAGPRLVRASAGAHIAPATPALGRIHVARSATVTGTLAALTAGMSPLMRPMPSAQASPNIARAGVTAM